MLVCVAVPLSPQVRQRVVETVVALGGEVIFAQDFSKVDASPTIIFGGPPIDFVLRQKRLRWVQTASAGVDALVLSGAFPKDVLLTSGTGVYGAAGGEHLLAMMLHFARGFHFYLKNQREGAWVREYAYARLLQGKTLVLLGLGDIGRHVVERARPFGMRILGVKRSPGAAPGVDRVYTTDQLDEVLPLADHLAITLPLTQETRGLIDRRRLSLLPQGAYIYNIGRGAVIDEEALLDALQSGHLGGAGLDVFTEEPLREGHPFWSMENVLITPHMGANTPWDHDVAAEIFMENLRRFVAGEPLRNRVDLEKGY